MDASVQTKTHNLAKGDTLLAVDNVSLSSVA